MRRILTLFAVLTAFSGTACDFGTGTEPDELTEDALALPPHEFVLITSAEAKLKSAPRLFAPAVASLRECDRLEVIFQDGAWYYVSFGALMGWVHAVEVDVSKEIKTSGEGVREKYCASEAAAGRKG